MRNAKTCPKCRAADIVRIPETWKTKGVYGNAIWVGWWPWNIVFTTRYLCAACGYSEAWVDSRDDIAKVKQHYAGR